MWRFKQLFVSLFALLLFIIISELGGFWNSASPLHPLNHLQWTHWSEESFWVTSTVSGSTSVQTPFWKYPFIRLPSIVFSFTIVFYLCHVQSTKDCCSQSWNSTSSSLVLIFFSPWISSLNLVCCHCFKGPFTDKWLDHAHSTVQSLHPLLSRCCWSRLHVYFPAGVSLLLIFIIMWHTSAMNRPFVSQASMVPILGVFSLLILFVLVFSASKQQWWWK